MAVQARRLLRAIARSRATTQESESPMPGIGARAARISVDPGRRGWAAWTAAWIAIVGASLLAAVVLAELSADSAETALDDALAQHLQSEAGLMAEAVRDEPIEVIAALNGGRSVDALSTRLGGLRDAALLHDVAAKSDAALIAAGRAGPAQVGPLYRAKDGQLYRAAYAAVPGHAGWVMAVEGSGATLGAVDQLEDLQAVVGAIVVALAALVGAALAVSLTRPLHRLDEQLSAVTPGDSPDRIAIAGPREVRRLATSARRLLGAIRERDAALVAAHAAQLRQLTAISATVAHEVRNPLHALGLTVVRLGRVTDPVQQTTLSERASSARGKADSVPTRCPDACYEFCNCRNVESALVSSPVL